MKQITKIYNIYTFEELSKGAKEKALKYHNEGYAEYPFLQDDLREYIHEKLTEKGYTHDTLLPLYSLSYCQGDGLMFEGNITDMEGNSYTVKHSGHYYHERSTSISGTDKDGEEIDTKDFEENIYIPICKEVAQMGYSIIEEQQSEEYFQNLCDANEYTFLADGTMVNE